MKQRFRFFKSAQNFVYPIIFSLLIIIPEIVFSQISKNNKKNDVVISGKCDQIHDGDTITLRLTLYGLDRSFEKDFIAVVKDNSYNFNIPYINRPHYIYLTLKNDVLSRNNLYDYLVEPADDIFISDIGGKTTFKGQGAGKFTCRYNLDSVNNSYMQTLENTSLDTIGIKKYFTVVDKSVKKRIDMITNYTNVISKNALILLRADILTNNQRFRDSYLNSIPESSRPAFIRALSGYHNDTWSKIQSLKDTVLIYSPNYANCITERYLLDSKAYFLWNVNVKKAYRYFSTAYSGKIRERIITSFLFRNRRFAFDLKPYLANALFIVKNPDFRRLLETMMTRRTIGSKSYEFSLTDTSGKVWHQSDFKGKVVLIDFWFTGCSNCEAIMPMLKEVEAKFEGLPIVFMTVSIDKNRIKWLNSIKGGSYTSQYSLNLSTGNNGMKDPLIEYYEINSFPTLLLIGKNGDLGLNPIDPRLDGGKNLHSLISAEIDKHL